MGQGAGNTSQLWGFMSSVLFKGYDDQTLGAQYEFPDHTGHTSIHMVGFVDDSNAQHNQFLQNKPVNYTSEARHQHMAGSRCYEHPAEVLNSPSVTTK
jgi:hypothetical protein